MSITLYTTRAKNERKEIVEKLGNIDQSINVLSR
jgi:hypothetical protein